MAAHKVTVIGNVDDQRLLSGKPLVACDGLHDNEITDVTPLKGLTSLTLLYLGNNNITDITPLAGLTNLTVLDLSGNNITYLTPLTNLTSLTNLDLRYTEITDDQRDLLTQALPNCKIKF